MDTFLLKTGRNNYKYNGSVKNFKQNFAKKKNYDKI